MKRLLSILLFLLPIAVYGQLSTQRLTTDTIRYRLDNQLPTHPPSGLKTNYWMGELWGTDSVAHFYFLTSRDTSAMALLYNISLVTGANRSITIGAPTVDHDGYDLSVFGGNATTGGTGSGGRLLLHGGQGSVAGGHVLVYGGYYSDGGGGYADVFLGHNGTAYVGHAYVNTEAISDSSARVASTKYVKNLIASLTPEILGNANRALSNLSSVAINAALVLGTSDAYALGSATKMWSDLYLASGGVINWNNGDVTLTHSSDRLTLNGILLVDSTIRGRDMISAFSSEAGKTEHRITLDASDADAMRIFAYDLTGSTYRPLIIGAPSALTAIADRLAITNISHATTDIDRFLKDSAGILNYRTGAEVLSDIGAQAAGTYITAETDPIYTSWLATDPVRDPLRLLGSAAYADIDAFATYGHNHIELYEPIISSKSVGYLKWTGSAWTWVNETYSLSTHNHSGVYDPAGTTATHAGLTTTAHGLGASAFHADSYFSLAGHDHNSTYSLLGHNHSGTYLTAETDPIYTSWLATDPVRDPLRLLGSAAYANLDAFLMASNPIIGTGSAGVDYFITFHGETSDGILQWMEDEDNFYFHDQVAIGINDAGTHMLKVNGTAEFIGDLTVTTGNTNLTGGKDYQIAGVSVNHVQAITITDASPDTGTYNGYLGINASFTVADATTITFTNLREGQSGNITVTCAAASKVITFAMSGKTIKVSPSVYTSAGAVTTSAGAGKIDVYSWWYDGTNIFINGTKGYL